jgi:hypothetical protein
MAACPPNTGAHYHEHMRRDYRRPEPVLRSIFILTMAASMCHVEVNPFAAHDPLSPLSSQMRVCFTQSDAFIVYQTRTKLKSKL